MQWSKMTTAQRQKNGEVLVIDPDCRGEGSARGTNAANDCDVIGDFNEFNMPDFLKKYGRMQTELSR